MIPYLVSGFLCVLFTFLGTTIKCTTIKTTSIKIPGLKCKNHNGKSIDIVNCFFYILAISCPCLLAALRDKTIGTDVLVYGDVIFKTAQNTGSFNSFLLHCNVTEPLFNLTVYCIAKTKNIYLFYFILQLFVVFPIFGTLVKFSRKTAWIGMTIYYLWLLGYTLNLMRQSIAIAIIFGGCKYIIENKPVRYLIVVLIAMGFHLTGIIGILLYLIYVIISYSPSMIKVYNFPILARKSRLQKFKKKYSGFFKFFIICAVFISMISASRIIVLIANYTGKYQYQVNHMKDNVGFSKSFLLLVGLTYLIIYSIAKQNKIQEDRIIQFCSFIVLCGMILYFLISVSSQLYRISLYFTSFFILYIPYTFMYNKKNKMYYVALFSVLVLLIGMDYNNFVLKGWNEIYPYQFRTA